MSDDISEMPAPVRKYFVAMNDLDSDGMIAQVSAGGLVNDVRREFWGPDAIKRWADREIVGDKVVWTAFRDAIEHHGDVVVPPEVDGEYDKTGLPDPVALTFSFSLEKAEITRLIIRGTKPGY